nr:trafficking protein particle complex subunit 8 [Onthophagus taurus]
MAHCKLTPHEFIKNAFTPQIAVICSPKVEEISQRNNLTFRELLQPFCKLGTEAHYKDPTGNVVSIRNFKINLQDINFRPPQPTLARKFLNSSVSEAPDVRFQNNNVGEYILHVPTSVPWFEQWRDTFLQVQFPSDHEFTKHFVACMLVISSCDENPVRTMIDLAQKVNDLQSSNKLPKWFSHNILRYYVVVHEKHDPNNVGAVECFDNLKMQFGINNVFLLRTNSRKPSQSDDMLPDPWSQFISTVIQSGEYEVTPEASPTMSKSFVDTDLEQELITENGNSGLTYHPLSPEQEKLIAIEEVVEIKQRKNVSHGSYLTMEDIEQLKLLIHEFCTRALFPFIERQVSTLHEFITNKKGVSRSFISATKRWFTPTKPGSSAIPTTPTYFPDAPELQVRRLGDLCFMFGHYTMAFQAYHTAKRDFNADQAWLFYAGALEMAALSAFMANETSRKTLDYMDESITTYLNICKLPQFATRATLLSSECLKGRQMYGEAAHQLIRMTSEESDLRSALLLEQAAYCFLISTKPCMVRKYAFHMVLAGHRFSKATQRKHSFRCYKQAFEVYENKGWNLAQDHIQYTIGRQASNLDLLEEAVRAYSKLLSDQSKQSSQQQAIFLKEYLTIQSALNIKNNNTSTQVLPLPIIDTSGLKLLVAPTPPLRTPGKVSAMGISLSHSETSVELSRWTKLEEMLVQEAQGSLPMIFKPLVTLFTKENATISTPTAILGEPIQVSAHLKNPLHINLLLKDVHLLWNYRGETENINNDNQNENSNKYLKTHYVNNIVLQSNSLQEVILMLTPLAVGEVKLIGICYSLVSSFSDDDQTEVKGKQLFDNKPDDKRFEIKIVPSASCLQVYFTEISSDMLKNELQHVNIELRNVGTVPLHKIYMATSKPELLSCCEFAIKQNFETIDIDLNSPAIREREARKNHVINLPLVQLEPGQMKTCNIWIKASDITNTLDLLIYYENIDPVSIPRYRLVRHVWNFQIHDSLKVDLKPYQSHTAENVEQLSLSLKAMNMNKIHSPIYSQITILNAAILSENWILLNEVVNPEIIELGPQDSAHILLKAKRILKKNINNQINFIKIPPNYPKAGYLDFAQRIDQNRINIFNESVCETNNDQKEGTVILRWKAKVADTVGNERYVYGQNQVIINLEKIEEDDESGYKGPIVFSDGKNDDNLVTTKIKEQEELQRKEQQIRCNVIHPTKIIHNFQINKLCIIRVKLLLHSTVDDTDLEVIIKTLETSNPFPSGVSQRPLFSPFSSKHCRWVQLGSTIRRLPPLNSETIDLSLAVLGPGTYDLGSHLEIWCQKVNQAETAILQSCRIQSSVIVTAPA